MKKTTLLSFSFLAISFGQMLTAQQIYTNGPLSTGATSNNGVLAPAGYTWSEVQNTTGNTTEANTTIGSSGIFNTAGTNSFQLADNFTVPAGQTWSTTSFDFFAYQTGSTAVVLPYDNLRVQVYSSDPAIAGAVSVAGNMTANVLDVAGSGDALMYRISNSTVPVLLAPGLTRKIWRLRGNLAVALQPGTYWVVYQVHPTNDGASFFPPVTIVGSRGSLTANAKQNVVASTATNPPAVLGWFALIDGGNPATAEDFPQDLTFNINGITSPLGVSDNAFEASIVLSPNPVKDIFTILVPNTVTISQVIIADINGKVVKQLNNELQVDVSDLAAGNYIVQINSDLGKVSKKFIKE